MFHDIHLTVGKKMLTAERLKAEEVLVWIPRKHVHSRLKFLKLKDLVVMLM